MRIIISSFLSILSFSWLWLLSLSVPVQPICLWVGNYWAFHRYSLSLSTSIVPIRLKMAYAYCSFTSLVIFSSFPWSCCCSSSTLKILPNCHWFRNMAASGQCFYWLLHASSSQVFFHGSICHGQWRVPHLRVRFSMGRYRHISPFFFSCMSGHRSGPFRHIGLKCGQLHIRPMPFFLRLPFVYFLHLSPPLWAGNTLTLRIPLHMPLQHS